MCDDFDKYWCNFHRHWVGRNDDAAAADDDDEICRVTADVDARRQGHGRHGYGAEAATATECYRC